MKIPTTIFEPRSRVSKATTLTTWRGRTQLGAA